MKALRLHGHRDVRFEDAEEPQLQPSWSSSRSPFAFDCVGYEASLATTINVSRKGGRVVMVGVYREPPTVDMNKVVLQERETVGCLAYVDDFPRAISLVADGRVDAPAFITDKIALRGIVDEGFQKLMDGPDKHVRIIVDPRQV